MKCRECELKFENDAQLHRHLKAHKMRQAEYYQKHFPRFDKFTGEIILFKNLDFYLTSDFNNKDNMKLWFSSASDEAARKYATELLLKFKEKRVEQNLDRAPCHVELRTLMMPSVTTYSKLFGVPFSILCQNFGLKSPYYYDNDFFVKFSKENPSPTTALTIATDTREKDPLAFGCKTIKDKLDFGDYVAMSDWYSGVFVERKSLSDFVGTLSEYDRFAREIQRVKNFNNYLIVLIESPFKIVEQFPKYFKFGKSTPEFIFHQMRTLLREFDCIQFIFANSREQAAAIVEKIFYLRKAVQYLDLQWAFDKGLLTSCLSPATK